MHFLSFKAIVTSSQRTLCCGLSQNLVCESPWLPMHNPPAIALVYLGNSQRKGYPHKPLMTHSLKKPQEFIFCVTSIDHDSSSVICLLGLGLLGDIDQVDSFVKSYID